MAAPEKRQSKLRELPGGWAIELALIVGGALAFALLVQAFIIKPYRIPSGSMEPTLAIGQRVLVNRLGTRFGHPHAGDIVVFNPPVGADRPSALCGATGQGGGSQTPCSRPTPRKSHQVFIKRVVAVGGDRISIRDGHLVRNGKRQSEPYTRPCGASFGCDFPTTITIPGDYYFLMGDNRGASDDSRFWGPVPESWIIGGAFATYWPPKRIGVL
jgi:signal peptidase I